MRDNQIICYNTYPLCVQDEEELFEGEVLSAEEQRRRELQKKILGMASDKYRWSQRKHTSLLVSQLTVPLCSIVVFWSRFSYKDDGYHMPDTYESADGRVDRDKQQQALTSRYEEEVRPKSEQDLWEEQRVKLARIREGGSASAEGEYEYVFEDQVEFISHQIVKQKKDALYRENTGRARPS